MSNEHTVRVNRDLIDWALQQTSTQCAISLAIKDANDRFSYPRVNQEKIAFTDMGTNIRYEFTTPEKLAKFIDQFDRDPSKCKPITFTLDLDQADRATPIHRRQPSETIARHQEYEANKGNKSRAKTPQRAASNIFRPLR